MQKSEILLEIILREKKKMRVFIRLPNAQTVLLLTRDLITARNHVVTSTGYTGNECDAAVHDNDPPTQPPLFLAWRDMHGDDLAAHPLPVSGRLPQHLHQLPCPLYVSHVE